MTLPILKSPMYVNGIMTKEWQDFFVSLDSSAGSEGVEWGLLFSEPTSKSVTENPPAGTAEIDRIGFGCLSPTFIKPGNKATKVIPFNCTVDGWYIESDVVGNVEVDIYKDLQTPVSIVGGGTKPNLTSASSNSGVPPSGWTTTSFLAGEILVFEVLSSPSPTINSLTMTLDITKT